MSGASTILTLCVVVLMAIGQVLFKVASRHLPDGPFTTLEALWKLSTNIYLVVGIVLYGLTTILWVSVLRDAPVSRAYPVTALTLLIVPIIGILLFKEPFSWRLVAGGVLIGGGIWVVSQS